MNNLYIDTSKQDCTTIGLVDELGNFVDKKIWESRQNQSEELLTEVDLLLTKNGIKLYQVNKILVVNGPGSYTGLRVGISTANALALSLNKQIIAIDTASSNDSGKLCLSSKAESTILPYYHKEPHITQPKNRHSKR